MQPQALLRITGTSVGTRTQKIEARAAQADENGVITRDAKAEGSYREVGISTTARYDGDLVPGLQAVLAVIVDDTFPEVAAGVACDWYVVPYISWRPAARGGRPYSVVAYRFVADLARTNAVKAA